MLANQIKETFFGRYERAAEWKPALKGDFVNLSYPSYPEVIRLWQRKLIIVVNLFLVFVSINKK